MTGFKTDSWESSDTDIAPKGADPNKASGVDFNDEHILGAWEAEDGESYLFRVINLDSPEGTIPHFTGENEQAGYGAGPETLEQSPNGLYVTSLNALASTQSAKGFFFDGENDTKEVYIKSGDSSGTAYSTLDEMENDGQAVTVHPDGTSETLDSDTLIPTAFFAKDGKEYGVFHTERDGMNSINVAEYQK